MTENPPSGPTETSSPSQPSERLLPRLKNTGSFKLRRGVRRVANTTPTTDVQGKDEQSSG